MPDLHIDRKTKSRLKLLKNKWVAFSLFIPLLIILGISTKIIIDLPSLEALRNGGKRWSQGVTFQDRQGRWIFLRGILMPLQRSVPNRQLETEGC